MTVAITCLYYFLDVSLLGFLFLCSDAYKPVITTVIIQLSEQPDPTDLQAK